MSLEEKKSPDTDAGTSIEDLMADLTVSRWKVWSALVAILFVCLGVVGLSLYLADALHTPVVDALGGSGGR